MRNAGGQFGLPPHRKHVDRGSEKYAVIKAVAQALERRSMPPMDERCKSIVASQIGALLKGGYPLDLVMKVAVELGLAWDQLRGHNRLTHLQARVRAIDTEEARSLHDARKAEDGEPIDPRVARILARPHAGGRARPHPSTHPFAKSERPNCCAACDGPIGVHVRKIGLDDDGNMIFVATGIAS